MGDDRKSELGRLRTLQDEFRTRLEGRLKELQDAWDQALSGAAGALSPDSALRRHAHSLAGAAGTFGFKLLGEQARKLELDILALGSQLAPTTSDQARIEAHLSELRRLTSLGPGEELPSDGPALEAERPSPSSLIYVMEDDALLAREIARQLGNFGYNVVAFTDPAQLSEAYHREIPAVLLADISLPEGELEGPRIAAELRDAAPAPSPVIFFSVHDHWQAHLAAVRAGGRAYFSKPLDFTALVGQLDRLTGHFQEDAFRILIVEDDDLLARHYSAVLRGAGMLTEIVSIPSELPERLSAFGPDLILMDIFLPGCTGVEAAQIIRQNPKFTHLPIVYLSRLDSRDEQLSALQAGGDDFLEKPITDAHLVTAVHIRARRFQTLNSMMSRDGLTGLLNHINLKLTLERELAQVRRRKGTLCLAMIDLDHFKAINDSYGHPVGDKVIKGLARLLTERLRKGDYAARYGGEEFTVVMPDTEPQAAFKVMDELRERFATLAHIHESGEFTASFSTGIASTPPNSDVEALLRAADQALYAAKHGGRNRVEMESPGLA
ncbi:MAG: diguanylate cyclase [Acidobacteriota bacterium]|nr:diguanylate cyclase [Acidobacteriota bacterium]